MEFCVWNNKFAKLSLVLIVRKSITVPQYLQHISKGLRQVMDVRHDSVSCFVNLSL